MKKTCCAIFVFCACILNAFSAPLHFTIGTSGFYPPFVLKTVDHGVYGFDISVVEYVCKKLKASCDYKSMLFKDLLPAIEKGEIDMAVSSIIITNYRKKRVLFSMPYMLTHGGYMTKVGSKINPKDPNFLNNKRIGIQEGVLYSHYVKTLKLKNSKIIYAQDKATQIENLMKGKVDIIVLDYPSAVWWYRNSHNLLQIIGKPFKIGQGMGIAIANKNKKYIPYINQAILDWENDGSFKKMYNVYFNLSPKTSKMTKPKEIKWLFTRALEPKPLQPKS